jgi:hypothetical protein
MRASRRSIFSALLGGAAVASLAERAKAVTTPAPVYAYPSVYKFQPYLTGSSAEAMIVYDKQPSNLWVEATANHKFVRWIAYPNLVWDDLPEAFFGKGSMLLAGMPPISKAVAATDLCEWSGNHGGFNYPTGGQFSVDTNLTVGVNGNWYLVISAPNTLPYNLQWPGGISKANAKNQRPGLLRGRLSGMCDLPTFEAWMAQQISAHKITPG